MVLWIMCALALSLVIKQVDPILLFLVIVLISEEVVVAVGAEVAKDVDHWSIVGNMVKFIKNRVSSYSWHH